MTTHIRYILLAVLASLIIIPPADAKPHLSMTTAKRDILQYEESYWKGSEIMPTIGDCRRHSAIQISCQTFIHIENEWIKTTDWATLLSHGVVRVHPGEYEITIALA